MLWRMIARGFEQFKCAADIALNIRARFINGITHARLRCEMDDHGVLVGGEEVFERIGCFKAGDHGCESVMRL